MDTVDDEHYAIVEALLPEGSDCDHLTHQNTSCNDDFSLPNAT